MSRLELRLLGGLEARLDGRGLEFPTRHSALLLAYLALTPDQAHSREKLAALLWSDRAEEQARGSLRQTLYRLRRLLEGLEPQPLQGDSRSVRLAGDSLWCDAAAFEQALTGDQEALGQALDLYKGDLLANWGVADPAFESWLSEEQLRLRKLAAAGFHRLAALHRQQRRFGDMEATARRLVELDCFDEPARRLLMTACALQDRRNAALAVYKDLFDLLQRELHVSPEPETVSLFETIRASRSLVSQEPPQQGAPAALNPLGESEPSPAKQLESPTTAPAPMTGGAFESDGTPNGFVDATVAPDFPAVAPSPAAGPERKQVTVLSANISGLTELVEDLDPEAAAQITDPMIRTIAKAVHRYGGSIASVLGDEVLALFGARTAYEDHAVRACHAALAARQRVRRWAGNVAVRICLHSGEMIVRPPNTEVSRHDNAVGPVVLLAKSVGRRIEPGAIGLTSATRERVEGFFQVRALDPSKIEGMRSPVTLFELVADTGARSRWQAWTSRGLTEFTGREAELAELRRALEQVRSGSGEVAAIIGGPGVGKSRLVSEFVRSSHAAGCLVLETGAASYDRHTSYLPVSNLLRSWLAVDERDSREAIADKLKEKIAELDDALSGTLPALYSVLDLPVEEAGWKSLSPPQRRRRMIDAVKSVFVRESEKQPLILIFEDLHWVDDETQAILNGLVDSIAKASLLLLVTYRPGYRHDWSSRSVFRLIRADALPTDSAHALLKSVLGAAPELEGLRGMLIERTGCVPLFLEESIRALTETGSLAGQPGAYQLAKPIETLEIPASVRAVLAARADRLPPDQKSLLQMAAVIGAEVPLSLLRLLTKQDEETLLDRLGELQSAEFLYETQVLPDVAYGFKHALTHEAAYESLLREQSRALHAELAGIIEAHYRDRLDEHIERLAHHASQGELWDKAASYLRQAGDKAVERSAYRQARAFLERGIEALGHLPDSAEVTRQAIDIRLRLRPVLIPFGEFSSGLTYLLEAEGLATGRDEQARLAAINLHKSYLLSTHGQFDDSIEAAMRARRIAKALDDQQVLHESVLALSQAYGLRGDAQRVIDSLVPMLHYWRSEHPHERFGQAGTRSIWCLGLLASAYTQIGDFTEALQLTEDACEVAQQTNRPVDLQFAYHRHGAALSRRGLLDECIPVLERALDVIRSNDTPTFFPWLAGDLGRALTLAGRADDAQPVLEEALNEAKRLELSHFEAWNTAYLGQALLSLDRHHEAVQLGESALGQARDSGDLMLEVVALRHLGTVQAAGDSLAKEKAEDSYCEAITLAEGRAYRPELAHGRLALGRLYAATGRPAVARKELSAAIDLYRSMDMTHWLPVAESALMALGPSVA